MITERLDERDRRTTPAPFGLTERRDRILDLLDQLHEIGPPELSVIRGELRLPEVKAQDSWPPLDKRSINAYAYDDLPTGLVQVVRGEVSQITPGHTPLYPVMQSLASVTMRIVHEDPEVTDLGVWSEIGERVHEQRDPLPTALTQEELDRTFKTNGPLTTAVGVVDLSAKHTRLVANNELGADFEPTQLAELAAVHL